MLCSYPISSATFTIFQEINCSLYCKVFIQNPILVGEGGTEEEVSIKNAVVGPNGVPRLTQGLEMIVPTSEQICCVCVCGAIDTQLSADGFLPGDMKAVWMIHLDHVISFFAAASSHHWPYTAGDVPLCLA